MDRRLFLQTSATAAATGSVWYAFLAQPAHAAGSMLRPPGALADSDFAATCVRCGRCVAACPVGTLKLADLAGPGAAGLPWFAPRKAACAMCPDLPCVKACPSGALDPALTDVTKARMGLAVIDAEHCLSSQGLRCEVCYRVCPVKGTAIRIAPHAGVLSKHAVFVPVITSDACTGCGLCEHACPTEVASIRVLRASLVQGRVGAHYRLGRKDEPFTVPEAVLPPPPAMAPATTPGVDYFNRGTPP